MSTGTILQIESSSSDDTFAIGERLGSQCRGGEFFLLSSDLGGGKTTFTKGLAKGLGSRDVVGSPTFTVSRVYDCRDGLSIHHFDFYRLNEGGMVAHELAEVLDDSKAIVVVEWGDVVSDVLPEKRITVEFERVKSGEDHRSIKISSPALFKYIVEGLEA